MKEPAPGVHVPVIDATGNTSREGEAALEIPTHCLAARMHCAEFVLSMADGG